MLEKVAALPGSCGQLLAGSASGDRRDGRYKSGERDGSQLPRAIAELGASLAQVEMEDLSEAVVSVGLLHTCRKLGSALCDDATA